MASGYVNSAGTDLDNLFYTNNGNAGAVGYVTSSNQDLGNRYTNANTLGYSVGYQNSAGTDLGNLRGNFNPSTQLQLLIPSDYPYNQGRDSNCKGKYTSGECLNWSYDESGNTCNKYAPDTIEVLNPTYWTTWWNSNSSATRDISNKNECYARPVHSSHSYTVALFAYSPSSTYPVTNLTVTQTNFSRWHNSWCFIATEIITVNNQLRYCVFAPGAGAGGGVRATYTITATFGNYGTKSCNFYVCYDNASNHTDICTSSSQITTSYTWSGVTYTWSGKS